MWILLFSEVTLFEYNVSTILSPIVALAIAHKIQKELRKKDNTFSPKPILLLCTFFKVGSHRSDTFLTSCLSS